MNATSARTMLHLVPTGDPDELANLAPEVAHGDLTVFTRDPACFIGAASPQTVAMEGPVDALVDAAARLTRLLDPDRSMALVGTDVVFLAADEPAPVRYQYLMHRRSDFDHERYLERYRSVHSAFGLRTPNLEGYVQFHVDLDRSAHLGHATGLLAPPCDSMSELHLRSVPFFVEGIVADPEVGREAQEDEERFVDRAASFGFCHRVAQGPGMRG